MIDKERHKEISQLYTEAILHDDKDAEAEFLSHILHNFMSYEKVMDEDLKRREDYLVEQDEIRVCSECGNPLIWTFAFAYKERYCLNCGGATPMFDGSQGEKSTPDLQFRYWLFNAIWSGLYRTGALVPKSRHTRDDCESCKVSGANHLDHLTERERKSDELAERFRVHLIGMFPISR